MATQLDFLDGLKTKKCISSNVPDYTLRKWYHVKVLLTEEVSFEWSHHRISYTDSKVRNKYEVNCIL